MSVKTRVLIVDDEPLARGLIRELAATDGDVEVVGECATAAAAAREIVRLEPDLVFLDVRMPGGSGFEALDGVPRDALPYVIFVTAYDQYALKAFEVHAVDYLLKPIAKDRFYESLRRAKSEVRKQRLAELSDRMASLAAAYAALKAEDRAGAGEPEGLVVRDGSTWHAVDPADIVWIEAADQYVRIHTSAGNHLVARSLTAFERELDAEAFFRIHRSALVNVRFVEEVRSEKNGAGSVLMATGERLTLSRRRRHLLPALLRQVARHRENPT